MINRKIFRDNDIRGIYPTDLDEGVMYKLGQALAVKFKPRKVALGKDMRESSESLLAALEDGLLSQGVNVVDLNMITTPMAYFAAAKYDYDLVGIVSSSHNPKEYNGLILAKKGGWPTNDEELEDLYRIATSKEMKGMDKEGKRSERDILDDWMQHAFTLIDESKIKKMKVVFDAGNSVAGIELTPALRKLKQIEATRMYFEPDGSFPHHIPNPLLKSTLRDLKEKVIREKAAMGLSYDGDADRVLMVDEKGVVVDGSMLTAYLCKYLLQKHKGGICLYTKVMSKIVPETIEKYGGKAHVVDVGHSYIKTKMRKEEAVFAGEHSGHFYFKDNYYNDSALIATLVILQAVSEDGRPVSEQMSEFCKYNKIDEISLQVEDRDKFIAKMEEYFQEQAKRMDKPEKVTHRDGITFEFEDYWFNLRPSGTEPVVRLNLESYKKGKANRLAKEVVVAARQCGAKIS